MIGNFGRDESAADRTAVASASGSTPDSIRPFANGSYLDA
jgi:hypothetical protein